MIGRVEKIAAACLLLAFLALSFPDRAQAETQDDQSEEKEERRLVVELMAGAGGLFSQDSKSPVLLLSAGAACRLKPAWSLGLIYTSKMHPWEEARSLFQTLGPWLRWNFWQGAFLDVGGGVAWSYIRRGVYQQSRPGGGWFLRIGYCYFFHEHFGLTGAVSVNQRWVGELYTDFGAVFGFAATI